MQTKKEANRDLAQQFAMQLKERTGLSWPKLDQMLGVSLERKDSGKDGETLERWANGRCSKVKRVTVQEYAKAAADNGLLPPLREGLLRRKDVYLAHDQTRDADAVWIEENERMKRIQKLQAKAIAAASAFAAALAEDKDLLVVDASISEEIEGRSCEIGADDVRAVASRLAAIRYVRLNIGSDA